MGSWQDIWVDPNTGQVRPGWRVLAYLGVLIFFAGLLEMFFIQLLTILAFPKPIEGAAERFPAPWGSVAGNAAMLGACLAVGAWALRVFDRLPFFTLGLSPRGGWLWQFLVGVLGGAACIGAALGLLAALGGTSIHWQGAAPAGLGLYSGLQALLTTSAVLLYLGYPFQTLLRSGGPVVAFSLGTIAFIAPALGSTHVSPLIVFNTAALGLLACLVYQRAGTLWPVAGLLAGWNIAQGLCGLPISGETIPHLALASSTVTGPTWLTGGAFGLEGSVLLTPVLLVALAVAALARIGHPLTARWWLWPELFITPAPPAAWDFRIGERHYQWKLIHAEEEE